MAKPLTDKGNQDSSSVLMSALTALLRPIAGLCLRHSLRIQEILECFKVALIAAAEDQLTRSGETITKSRLHVMTGIHRKDIDRLSDEERTTPKPLSLIPRIIGQWLGDKNFRASSGTPRTLSFEGDNSDFHRLVRSVSRELNPAAVLFELERTAIVERRKDGLKLLREGYAPADKIEHAFGVLAADCDDLMRTVEENIAGKEEIPNLHARTVFDNVHPESYEELRRWLMREGHELHRKARAMLSELDRDINPQITDRGHGVKVVLGTFSRISPKDAGSEK
jgi:hypothetical protein